MASTTADLARAGRKAPGRGIMHEMRQNIWPYIFISPFFILFIIFGLFPYLYAFYLSFLDWDGISPPTFVGLANYRELLTDDLWWKSLYNSVWLLVVTNLNLVFALVLAFILNSGLVRFKEVFRTAYFTPIVASSIAVTMIFTSLFGLNYGMLNYILKTIGLQPIDWLGSAFSIKPAIALVVIWRYFGWNTVIYLAGLQSIPTDLYEAARVDGARWKDIFLHITMPLLRPVITFTVILSIIGALQLFDEALMLAGGTASSSPGGTDRAGLTVMVNLYANAFVYVRFGYAAAMSVGLFVVIVIFSFLYNRFLGKNLTE
jgi:ABC-type sugar transport system permease subunit